MRELEKYLYESMFDDKFGIEDEKVMPLVNIFKDAECNYYGDMSWNFLTKQKGDFNWMSEWMDSSVAKHYGIKQLAKKSWLGFNVFSNGSWYPGIKLKNLYCLMTKSDNGVEFTLFYPVRESRIDNVLYYIEICSDQLRHRQSKFDVYVFMKSRNVVEIGSATNETVLYSVPKKYLKEIFKALNITKLNKYI